VTEAQFPELHQIVKGLADRAGIPMPRLYVSPSQQPNAFATGRNPEHAAVAVTQGILPILDRRELEGVLAHELSHVQNRDILISSVAATIGAVITWVGPPGHLHPDGRRRRRRQPDRALLTVILAPIAALLIQMAISRSREFGADSSGARLTHDPRALASALRKIEAYSRGTMPATTNPVHRPPVHLQPVQGRGLAWPTCSRPTPAPPSGSSGWSAWPTTAEPGPSGRPTRPPRPRARPRRRPTEATGRLAASSRQPATPAPASQRGRRRSPGPRVQAAALATV
jgi:Zn-dependent protease with chaperone function